jgi:hypothetical protein
MRYCISYNRTVALEAEWMVNEIEEKHAFIPGV